MKKKILYFIGAIFLIIVGYFIFNNNEEDLIINSIAEEQNIIEKSTDCYADVKGEVVNPGVYDCVKNNKVIDLINVAGGLTKNADTSVINLSKVVSNEMLIIVYSKRQIEDAKKRLNEPTVIEIIKEVEKECICPDVVNDSCEFTEVIEENNNVNEEENNNIVEETNLLININTDSKERLMELPKIGEAKAQDIIDYRTKTPFEKIEDIMNVSGIGEATFNGFKDLIKV